MTAACRLASAAAAPETATAPPTPDLVTCVEGTTGARPVIRGTRITVAAVKGRVSGGDSLDDLAGDHPGGVPREAFEAALAYDDDAAEARPVRGAARRDV